MSCAKIFSVVVPVLVCGQAVYAEMLSVFSGAALREAVIDANRLPGEDTIHLGQGVFTLDNPGRNEDSAATGDLDIRENLIIVGEGPGKTTIDAARIDRVFQVFDGASLSLGGLTITGGQCWQGGGIYNAAGTLCLDDVTICGNQTDCEGGGIYNDHGVLTLTNATICGNSTVSRPGGGICNDGGTVTAVNVTISENYGDDGGGGIYNCGQGSLSLTNTTVCGNSVEDPHGGGIENAWGTASLENSIVAGNFHKYGAGACDVCGEFDAASSCNLIGVIDGSTNLDANGTVYGAGASPLAAMLGPLQDNGGSTFTHAVLAGSPAIDAGNNAVAPQTDQRGYPRQGIVDVGAFEYGVIPEPSSLALLAVAVVGLLARAWRRFLHPVS